MSSRNQKDCRIKKLAFFPRLINNQPPSLTFDNTRMKLTFNEDFLKEDKVTHNHGPIVNIIMVYRLIHFTTSTKRSTLGSCLFGAAKLTTNDDISK